MIFFVIYFMYMYMCMCENLVFLGKGLLLIGEAIIDANKPEIPVPDFQIELTTQKRLFSTLSDNSHTITLELKGVDQYKHSVTSLIYGQQFESTLLGKISYTKQITYVWDDSENSSIVALFYGFDKTDINGTILPDPSILLEGTIVIGSGKFKNMKGRVEIKLKPNSDIKLHSVYLNKH